MLSCKEKKFYKTIEKLSPKSNLCRKNIYVASLKAAWKDKNVKNIAVMGPYGSGKSSVVRSFINSLCIRKKRTLYFSQESLFNYYKDYEKGDDDSPKTEDNKLKLSKVIYNELLKHDSNGLAYKKIISGFYGFSFTAVLVNVIFFIFGVCFSAVSSIIIYKYAFQSVLFSVLCGFGIFAFLLYIHFSYILKKIKGKTDKFEFEFTRITNDDAKLHPTFEENALINQIKKNRIRFIVVEDLERLMDNPNFNLDENDKKNIVKNCLVEFKILCDLIARSKIIKRKVCFIYGLNDGCFEIAEDRSKYFDFILNILPRVSSSNAAQFLIKHPYLKENKIDEKIISNVSVFIENERIANSLLAEFKIHSKLQNKLDLNKVFVMCALNVVAPKFFKTLFDKDNAFTDLYSKNVVKQSDIDIELIKVLDAHGFKGDNLKKFLVMCINHKYIDRGYRSYLCLNSENSLTENDNEFYKLVLARFNCFNHVIDEPDNLIKFDIANELIYEPNKYIISSMITCNDVDKKKAICDALENKYNSETLDLYFTYLIEQELIDFDFVFKNICHLDKIYKVVVSCLTSTAHDVIDKICLVFFYRMKFFPNTLSVCDSLIPIINSCDNFDNVLKLHGNYFDVVTKCNLIKIEKLERINNAHSLEIISNNNSFDLNYSNLTLVYDDFAKNPLNFLALNPDFFDKTLNYEKLIGTIIFEFSKENLSNLLSILGKIDDSSGEKLLKLDNFENFRLEIDSSSLTSDFNDILIENNMLKMTEETFNDVFSDEDECLEYVKRNYSLILKKNLSITESWGNLIIENFDDEEFKKVVKNISNAISKVSHSNKSKRYFDIYTVNKKTSILQGIIGDEPSFVFDKYYEKKISYNELSCLCLNLKAIDFIFTSNYPDLFHLALKPQNQASFVTFIQNNPGIYSDKIFVDETNKVISCENETIVEWFIANEHHSFETKSYIAEASSDAILKKNFWISFLKSFGKVLKNKNIHIEKNTNNKRILDALFRAKVIKYNKEFKNLYSIKIL